MSAPAAGTVITLDPLSFPLRGTRLIEASAGTGKTFTIAALYVRLVLGHGDAQTGFGRPLLPPEVLVVTFTNAATRELRDRIRVRLVEAAHAFRGLGRPDAFLAQLLDDPAYRDASARASAARRLELAAEWMDEAAVHTIHGWCQRMLTQHAFDTGSLFHQELEQNDAELLAEMTRDYWRSWCYALAPEEAREFAALAADPDALLRAIRPLLQAPELRVEHRGEPLTQAVSPADFAAQLRTWLPQKNRLEQQARALWRSERAAIETQLMTAASGKILNNQSYKPATLPERLAQMAAWAAGAPLESEQLGHFARDRLEQKTAKARQGETPDHAVFTLLEQLVALEASRPPLHPVRLHAAQWVGQRFALQRERTATLGFNDMLLRLDAALQGPGAEALAHSLRRQYPVALIDEFQDTDPLQYRIFSRVYAQPPADSGSDAAADTAPGGTSETPALLMIGDPKQAIYAFRGADIHTYLHARRDTVGRHYTLGRNFRSSTALVSAVNRLFAEAEAQHPGGAFRFAREGDNPLPFLPVAANGRAEVFEVEGNRPAALTHWLLADELSVGEYRSRMAASCATEIRRLLALGQQGKAGFRDPEAGFSALRPQDIAVLVRSGSEAAEVRAALDARGVRSVYLSDKESVYAGAEATDLWLCLRACAEPERPGRIQAALASATLGLEYARLEQLNRDEQRWEQEVERFRGLRETWRQQGVLALVRRLLDAFDLPARLLAEPGGERVLTNLLHLAELLQAASVQLEGELALLRYLQEQILDTGDAGEEQIMRLESDADRVQVVTVHKAKGLEYPLVFLPFACSFREVTARDHSYCYQREGRSVLELDKRHEPAKAAADAERLQEDLRLLYVAFTRPVHACWLGVGLVTYGRSQSLHKSAFGQLLGILGKTDSDTLVARLGALATQGEIAVGPPPTPDDARLALSAQDSALAPARQLTRPANTERWWIASYSAIARLRGRAEPEAAPEAEPAQTASEETARETREEIAATGDGGAQSAAALAFTRDPHHFWKGPAAGTFLHGMLEWAAGQGFARVAADAGLREEYLAPRCQRREWQPWLSVLERWLQQLLLTPLPLAPPRSPPDSLPEREHEPEPEPRSQSPSQSQSQSQSQVSGAVPLAALATYQAELEFWFAVADTPVARLDLLITRHVLPGHARPALLSQQLGGMLKGFVDLVFEHGGRYWVADYKSNWLGPDHSHYRHEAMQQAVLEKRYDVQYVLYLLALHRLLKARLPGYAEDPEAGYERHVGGALYLFLRGIDEPVQHGCCIDRPAAELIVALDRLLAGEEPLDA